METNQILCGDARELAKQLPDNSIHCIVTSPPYWNLRDYGTGTWEGGDADCDHRINSNNTESITTSTSTLGGSQRNVHDALTGYGTTCGKCGAKRIDQQIGLEDSVDAYVDELVGLFRELRRALHPSGTLWLNLAASWAGSDGGGKVAGYKRKDMIPTPWLVAMALQQDGYYLRQDIIWHKKAPMPASVKDRPTPAHEYLFLLSKNEFYFYDQEAIREPHKREWGKENRPVGGRKHRVAHDNPMARNGSGQYDRDWDKGDYSAEQNPAGANRRSVWTLGPESYKGSHFAVMPTKLVSPCILAGTSAYGVCPQCNAPWERVVEHTKGDTEAHERPKQTAGMQSKTSTLSLSGNGSKEWAERGAKRQTIGWRPTCQCKAGDPVPATVLDPFLGSGTVASVAISLGRNWLGFELNPAYVDLCRRRIEKTQPALLAV
jgi:DNA modification methylase